MLPTNILDMVRKLLEMTRQGQLTWEFDYYNDRISASLRHFDVKIMYHFDSDSGLGYFYVDYFDKDSQQWHRFSTNIEYRDYDIVKQLYDEGQATKLNIRF